MVSMEGSASLSDTQPGQRACDQCRTRKIRCDKSRPCASCRASDLICQASSNRPKEQKQRVLISSKYESKIDGIGHRLAKIEHAMRELQMTSACVASSDHHIQALQPPAPAGRSVTASLTTSPEPSIEHFEGGTSLSACSSYANDQLQAAFRNTKLLQEDPDLSTALTSLGQVILAQNVYPEDHLFASTNQVTINRPKCDLPPAEVVLNVLRACQHFYDTAIVVNYPVRSYQEIIALCKELYFNMDDLPTPTLIVAFGSLYFIFGYYQFLSEEADEELDSYTDTFLRNMLNLFGMLPILLPPSMENLEALLLGACYAIEESKPSMCSALLSKAGHLCLTLGYHRSASMIDDLPELRARKINLFWYLYSMDKGLCLRLGQASLVQDYDIDVPWPSFGDGEIYKAGNDYCKFICKFAGLQGRVYEELYSPSALRGSVSTRKACAEALALDLDYITTERDQIRCPSGQSEDIIECFLLADKVAISTTLTLVLRAIPPNDHGRSSSYSAACMATARQTLHLHHTCTAKILATPDKYALAEYVHWALLHTPCVPYLVLFCHIIETQSTTDLVLLGDFLQTLKPVRAMSSAIEKLYLICDVFHRVAKLYIRASTKNSVVSDCEMSPLPIQTQQELRDELSPFMTRMGMNGVLDASVRNNNANNNNIIDHCSIPGTSDTIFDTNIFGSSNQFGEWFTEDQLITSLLGNRFNFMDPNVAYMATNNMGFM